MTPELVVSLLSAALSGVALFILNSIDGRLGRVEGHLFANRGK